jgi:hypothetical protein
MYGDFCQSRRHARDRDKGEKAGKTCSEDVKFHGFGSFIG